MLSVDVDGTHSSTYFNDLLILIITLVLLIFF